MADESAPQGSAETGEVDVLLERGDQLLFQAKDLDGAQAAYEEVEEAGDVRGALKVAMLMEDYREDPAAAEAAWRRADEAGHVDGAGNLGRLLREQGDTQDAEAAFRRCVERGSERAVGDWAGLLFRREDATSEEVAEVIARLCKAHDKFVWHEDTNVMVHVMVLDEMEELCDPAVIEVGTRRADDQGSAAGAWHLAWVLRRKGDLREAIAAFRRAAERGFNEAWVYGANACFELGDTAGMEVMARDGDKAGSAKASTMLGTILEENDHWDQALEAYERGDAGGDGNGSFNLGAALWGRGDLRSAEAALQRAVERGNDQAAEVLAQVRSVIAIKGY